MAFIKRMIGQDYIDKYREYLDYLEEHIENVRRAFCELSEICEGMWWVGDDMAWHKLRMDIEHHDLSKFSQAEFIPYVSKFFPTDHELMEWPDNGFDKAWEHHKKNNTHHHESVRDNLDIVHMIIDWTAMGYKFGDTAQEYYEKNQHRISLSENHIKEMYEIFHKIAEKTKIAKDLGFEKCEWPPEPSDKCEKCGHEHRQMYWSGDGFGEGTYWCLSCILELNRQNEKDVRQAGLA